MAELKVAIVHDWFTVSGGAEKVCRELLALYPSADVYSLIDFLSPEHRKFILNGKKSNTSLIQRLPFARRAYRFYLPLFPYAVEQLNLEQYDLIISSSYAVAKGVLSRSDQVHICYCHSPMRYLWDLYFSYIPPVKWYNFPYAMLMRWCISRLRIWDVVSSNRVDYFLANSKHVAGRIEKIYRRTAEVVYPPLDTAQYELVANKEPYYVTASRLVPYKKVDLIVAAFKEMPDKQLVVLGDGPEFKRLRKLAGDAKNIRLLGFVKPAEHRKWVSEARAFINASYEDFGIAPLEAQACGTPIVGYARGGLLETTRQGKTAVYFEEQSVSSVVKAIQQFEQSSLDSPAAIREFALGFSNERFHSEMKTVIAKCLK